jgi:hypothetical protein
MLEAGASTLETYMHPIAKSEINPALLFPPNCNMRRKGRGRSRTSRSKSMLLAEWPRNMAKNVSGIFVPQPMHDPGREVFQYLVIGWQGNIPRRKNVMPQAELKAMRAKVVRRARRYWALVVEAELSAKSRRYWKRMASLISVALAQYETLEL